MNYKKLSILLLIAIIFSSFSLAASNPLKIHFVDVGQADCILIQTPNGKSMLVDAGDNVSPPEDNKSVTQYLNTQKISKIDILIGTAPQTDHIGAMDKIINNYQIGSVYMPKVEHRPTIYKNILLAIKAQKIEVKWLRTGSFLDLDPSIKIEILAPNSVKYNSSKYSAFNEYSTVLRISYGKTSFLLTGDAGQVSQGEMLAKGYNLKANVLKVSFHGDINATSAAFLNAVSPKYAIISVGKHNYYAHPHKELLDLLQKSGITIFRTDLDGTIVATSDGQKIKFDKKASSVKPMLSH